MSFIISIFNLVFYQPLFNGLVLAYKYIPGHDFGVAIIFLTVLIKLLLYPLGNQAIKSQKALSEIQPKIKEIQEKYKNDKEKQVAETMAIYKKMKVNPFSGFLSLFIQLPVLIALYRVFWHGFGPDQMKFLYGFVSQPESINFSFLGLINLSQTNIAFAVLAGVLQFFQARMVIPKVKKGNSKGSDFSVMMQKQSQYFLPFFTLIILIRLPAAIGLYWITTTLFSIIQQYLIFKKQSVKT